MDAGGPTDVVQRFLASLEGARHLPDAEVAALLRVAELDGPAAAAIREAVRAGQLFGAGLRELVGRYAMRGPELAAFVLRDILERSLAETSRLLGIDERAARKRVEAARKRLGLAADADRVAVGQWLVTELIAPPTRALQLQLFATEEDERGSGSAGPGAGAPASEASETRSAEQLRG